MEEKEKINMKEGTKELKDLIEAAGYEARDYSGRAMFGDRCLAFTTEQGTSELRAFADMIDETAGDLEQIEVLSKAMRNARVDSMGLGLVIYFPAFEYDEQEDDEDDEEGPESPSNGKGTEDEEDECATCADLAVQGVTRRSCPECGTDIGPGRFADPADESPVTCTNCGAQPAAEDDDVCGDCHEELEYNGPTHCGDCGSNYDEGMEVGIVCPCCKRGTLERGAA